MERIWRREGLKVPQRQPKRGRLWLNDGSCVRLRPERPGHVWAYDFVEDRTRDGRKFRMLCVVDEFTREALAIRVARKLSSADVIDVLADLFIGRGAPAHIRSDQGPEFVADVPGALPFCALGLLLGTLVKGQGAPAVINMLYLPMAFLSGLWFPLQALPKAIQAIAPALPSYHLNALALDAVDIAHTRTLPHVAVLAAFTVGALWLAARRLRKVG